MAIHIAENQVHFAHASLNRPNWIWARLEPGLHERIYLAPKGTLWDIEIEFDRDVLTLAQNLEEFRSKFAALNQPEQLIGHSVIAEGLSRLTGKLFNAFQIKHVRWSIASIWIDRTSPEIIISAARTEGVKMVRALRWTYGDEICEHFPGVKAPLEPVEPKSNNYVDERKGRPEQDQ